MLLIRLRSEAEDVGSRITEVVVPVWPTVTVEGVVELIESCCLDVAAMEMLNLDVVVCCVVGVMIAGDLDVVVVAVIEGLVMASPTTNLISLNPPRDVVVRGRDDLCVVLSVWMKSGILPVVAVLPVPNAGVCSEVCTL